MDTFTPAKTDAFEVPKDLEKRIDEVITHYPDKRSAAGMVLHYIQEHMGFISDEAVFWTAEKLDLQPINILELVTFYPMYRQHPVGKRHIRVCRTLSCAMCGSYEVLDKLCQETGIDKTTMDHHHPIGISADGEWSIEFVECLASCGTAPVLMVEEELFENVTVESIPDLLKKAREKAEPNPINAAQD